MKQRINAPVSVYLKSDCRTKKSQPVKILWGVQEFHVDKVVGHVPRYSGKVLFHDYAIMTKSSLMMYLRQNSATQQWILVETDDGELN
jgi:hypothetical protein